jgi:alpha-mannosidase
MQRIAADPDRRLASIVLPADRNMHIFAITLGPPVRRSPVYGVSLLNNAKYGHDVMGSTMRLTLLRASRDPDPRPDVGIHEFTYSLYPHVGDWRTAGTVRRAYELNTPMLVRVAGRHAGPLPRRYSFIRVSPDNLVLGSVKRAEHSDDLVLRVYETSGSLVQAQLWLAQRGQRATECNHVEVNRAGSRAGLYHGHVVEVPIGPHQVKTVKVRR